MKAPRFAQTNSSGPASPQRDGEHPTDGKQRIALPRAVAIRGIGITLLLAAIAAAIVWWTAASQAEQETLRNERFWDSYLTTLYGLHGSWTPVAKQLAADNAFPASFSQVQAWDTARLPVFASGGFPSSPEGLQKHPILYRGAVVGYFAVNAPQQPFIAEWKPYLALLAAAIAGIGLFLALARSAASEQTQEQERIRGRISRMLGGSPSLREYEALQPEIGNYREDGLDGQEIDLLLHQLELRIRKLEKVRKTMVADIAHELRTPLAVMRAQLDNAILRQTPIAPEGLVLLHDEVYRITKLVHDLQQLALAESGHLPLDKQWFSLRALAFAVAEALEMTSEESGCRISVTSPDEARIYGDQARIQQVLVNIIGNAIRHAKSNVRIVVESNERQAVIFVTDDGRGIEEDELPHVFDRFYRGSRKRDKDGGSTGLGLGLAIVKEYVEAHQGHVTVNSIWGSGTTFSVAVPIFAEA